MYFRLFCVLRTKDWTVTIYLIKVYDYLDETYTIQADIRVHQSRVKSLFIIQFIIRFTVCNQCAYMHITTQMNDFIHEMKDELRNKNYDNEMICSTEPGS